MQGTAQKHPFQIQGQLPHSATGGLGHGAGNGGSSHLQGGLANGLGPIRAIAVRIFYNYGLNFGHVTNAGYEVFIKIQGLDFPFILLHFFQKGVAQALGDAAVNLAPDRFGIDGPAYIMDGCNLEDAGVARFHVYFHFRHLAAVDIGKIRVPLSMAVIPGHLRGFIPAQLGQELALGAGGVYCLFKANTAAGIRFNPYLVPAPGQLFGSGPEFFQHRPQQGFPHLGGGQAHGIAPH